MKRSYKNLFMDSSLWDGVTPRHDDVIIASYGKSGTTWVQQIVGQLLSSADPNLDIAASSPWVERRASNEDQRIQDFENTKKRRFLKTHLPADALPENNMTKCIYIARDGRDVAMSFHNHHAKANQVFYDLTNAFADANTPGITPPSEDSREYVTEWLDQDGHPFWPYWENVRSWWDVKDEDNVLLLHFNDLKEDPEKVIQQIADFIDVDLTEELLQKTLQHSRFEFMKNSADLLAPANGKLWDGGGKSFFHSGMNKRWEKHLTAEDNQRYSEKAVQELGEQCASWLSGQTQQVPARHNARQRNARLRK